MEQHFSKTVKLEITRNIPSGLESLIKETIYGRDGKLQYKHRSAFQKLQEIDEKLIFTINRNDIIINTVVLVERFTHFKEQRIKSFYIRYLTFDKSFKSKKKQEPAQPEKPVREGSLRKFSKSYISDYFNSYVTEKGDKAVFYAYIEHANLSSFDFAGIFDFESIRKVQTLIFSRFNPVKIECVGLMNENEKSQVIENLNKTYHDYALFSTEEVFRNDNYYVYRKDNEIIAGIKASPVTWDIIKVPGLSGFVMQHILPHLPYFSKLFKSHEMNFLAFEGVWFKEGCEDQAVLLMESVCKIFKQNIGMLWFDKECRIGKRIQATNKLGLLNKLKSDVNADIIFNYLNMNEEEKNVFRNYPSYISAYDLT